jgi:glycosyltransferase involved in cell wall biosynthesis
MIKERATGNGQRATTRVFLVSPWGESDPREVRGAPDVAYLVQGMREKGWEVRRVAPVEFRLPQAPRLIFLRLEIVLNLLVIPWRGLSLSRRFGKPSLVVCLDGKLVPGALVLSSLTRSGFAKFQHGIKDYLTRKNRFLAFLLNPDVILNYRTGGRLFAIEDGSGAWELGKKNRNMVRLPQARPVHVPDVPREKAFAFCGRLHGIKGAASFLRVARLVKERVPSAGCLVIGTGPLLQQFREEAWINLLGELPHDEAVSQLARARALCATAPYGNFTLPVLEAMSSGTVPVAFGVGWTREMISDAGVVVPHLDEEAMAREVARLLEDDEFFREKSRAALERAKAFPTWEQRTGEILDCLEALCSVSS